MCAYKMNEMNISEEEHLLKSYHLNRNDIKYNIYIVNTKQQHKDNNTTTITTTTNKKHGKTVP